MQQQQQAATHTQQRLQGLQQSSGAFTAAQQPSAPRACLHSSGGASSGDVLRRAALAAHAGAVSSGWGAGGRAAICTHARVGLLPHASRIASASSGGAGGALASFLARQTGGGSGSGSGGPALCAAGPLPAPALCQAAGLTRNQLLNGGRKPKPKRRNPTKALKGAPQRKGICVRVYTVPPKKPNSANRTIAKVALSTGVKVVTYVPGESHNLQVRDDGRWLRVCEGVRLRSCVFARACVAVHPRTWSWREAPRPPRPRARAPALTPPLPRCLDPARFPAGPRSTLSCSCAAAA